MAKQNYDNIMGPKVSHVGTNMLNLLRVIDLPKEEQAKLIQMGYGDLLKDPIPEARVGGNAKDRYDMQLEAQDTKRASTITFKFVTFRPSHQVDPASVPKRFHLQLRFFTFPEIRTDSVALVEPGVTR